jgi:hypothetical protein
MKYIFHKFKDVFFYSVLRTQLNSCKSILDVGCGEGSPIQKVKKSIYKEGIDVYSPSIVISKKSKIHNKYTLGDIKKLHTFYKPKSFEAVIAIDVIEHFTKLEALKLIKDMEKIAIKKIVLMTPNGFCKQEHTDGNTHQNHKSGWTKKDLEELGYTVRGLRGLKWLRGEYATIKWSPWIVWGTIAFIIEAPLYYLPSLSYHLIGIKDIE